MGEGLRLMLSVQRDTSQVQGWGGMEHLGMNVFAASKGALDAALLQGCASCITHTHTCHGAHTHARTHARTCHAKAPVIKQAGVPVVKCVSTAHWIVVRQAL